MKPHRFPAFVAIVAMLSACGGGGGSSGGGNTGGVTPTPAPSTAGCDLASRKAWVLGQLNEWYLFPESFDASVNPASYPDVQSYIDALVAPARALSKDRYFTYITSIAQENAFYQSGSSAGFGIRLSYDTVNKRLFVMEAFEGAPALSAGIDRGTEITAIGTTPTTLVSVATLFAQGGSQAVSDALGPSTAGTTRTLTIVNNGVTTTVTVGKADYGITPVSARYGVKVLDNGGTKVGYVNLRTFIDTADPALRSAFAQFKAQGITQVVVDLRYNGGGLVSIGDLFSDLLRANNVGQVSRYLTYRASKASNNETRSFAAQAEAIASTKVAFIGTGGTASASEFVINSMSPYLGANNALIGANTYGKPVGQIALDKSSCDDRLRAIAFRIENAAHQGDYYTGLASVVPKTCAAADDLGHPLGDVNETSIRVALDFLAGRACTAISAGGQGAQGGSGANKLLTPENATTAQRETPGLF